MHEEIKTCEDNTSYYEFIGNGIVGASKKKWNGLLVCVCVSV